MKYWMNNNSKQKWLRIVFVIYLCILLSVIVFKFPTRIAIDVILKGINGKEIKRLQPQLIPFNTISLYWSRVQTVTDWFFKNLFCNITIFIPYGLLFPFILEGKKQIFRKTVISGVIFIICIEIFQYVSALGHCDIDDLIMNTASILIGYGLYMIARTVISRNY